MVAESKIRANVHFHARTIAVVPRFGRVSNNVVFPFQLGVAQQRLFQDGALDFQLLRVSAVLVVASAATGKVRAPRLPPIRGRLAPLVPAAAGTPSLFFD